MISVHLFTYETPDDDSFLIQVLPDFLERFPDNLEVSHRQAEFSAYWTLTGDLEVLFCVIDWKSNRASVWYIREIESFNPLDVINNLQIRYGNASGN